MLKLPKKDLDVPVLIRRILTDTNCSIKELASATGYSESYLKKVRVESMDGFEIQRAVNLLGIYLLNTTRNIPLVGDVEE
ncbi:MAG: hypothetical protein WC967_13645 [Balneolaceae bacterium]